MRSTLVGLLLCVALAACAGNGDGSLGTAGGTAGGTADGTTLEADLFPFTPSQTRFVTSKGEPRELRVEPGADGQSATLWIKAAGAPERRMDIRRQGGAIFFSAGPGLGTELLRLGAAPGASWRVGRKMVNFDGWDRIETPAGTYDAARISTTRGPESFQERETWWFAPREGLVRYRKDNAGVWENEMWRTN